MRKYLCSLLAVVLLSGLCLPAQAAYQLPYYIGVDLTNQIVTIYNTADNSVARQMLCSSGMNNSTPEGTFYLQPKGRVTERTPWTWLDQYHCYVKYATRIYHGYLFHSIPFEKRDMSTMIQQNAKELGMPTSHGCMRLRVDDARFIAKNCDVGTLVRIYREEEKQEELRELLRISSYTGEDDMSYTEFLGYSEDALGRGSGGTEVFDLQLRLRDLGYYGGEISGRYDTELVAAVKHVQADLGLSQTGITTPELAEVLYSEDAPISAGQISLREGSSGPVVKRLQEGLARLGLYEGEPDSVYDVDVADAVRSFQALCNYAVDGVATPTVQETLYYLLAQLDETFGADADPTAEVITEEVDMATLHAEANIIVRQKASTKSESLGKLHDGDTMFLDAVKGDWAKISRGKLSGFVLKKYLEPYKQENVMLRFTAPDGKSTTIGHTMEEYRDGAGTIADEFADYAVDAQAGAAEVLYATVDTGSPAQKLNLRAAADSESAVLAEVPNGTKLRVLREAEGWTQVGFGEQIGYLLNDYLRFSEGSADEVEDTTAIPEEADSEAVEEEADASGGSIRAVVICGSKKSAPVYKEGSADAKRLGKLPAGTQIEVLSAGEGDNWVHIRYRGREGYMRDANLQFQLM